MPAADRGFFYCLVPSAHPTGIPEERVDMETGTLRNTLAMTCPVCHTALQMTSRQGIEIDYCPQCRGVWLDRGELDKIIERSAAAPAPVFERNDRADYRDRRNDDRDYRDGEFRGHRKRRSWLEDLFD